MQLFSLELLGLTALMLSVTASPTGNCYAKDKNPYLYLGSKTPYFVTQQKKASLPSMKGCKPMQIWIAARHGTRYPQAKAIKRMQGLPKFRDQIMAAKTELCKQDMELLKKWKVDPNMVEPQAGYLTKQGEKDMQLFGGRIKKSFPDLFKDSVNAQNYKFRATKTQRTENSMQNFMLGIFKSKTAVSAESAPDNDLLLNGYKSCPAWERSLVTDKVEREAEAFKAGPEFKKLVADLSARLGVQVDLQSKSAQSVKMLYDTCRFEKSWDIDHVSAWCSVFSKEELQLLEYLEDLEHYYESGPGREINKKLGCPMLEDIFKHFKNLESGGANEPKGIFYFTHMVTVQTLMTVLGIGKDSTALTARNYASMSNRKFRTSMISSFASNVGAVFYKCSDKSSPHKVLFMVNEKPADVEGCAKGVCDWKMVQQRFGTAAKCDPNFCTGGASSSG